MTYFCLPTYDLRLPILASDSAVCVIIRSRQDVGLQVPACLCFVCAFSGRIEFVHISNRFGRALPGTFFFFCNLTPPFSLRAHTDSDFIAVVIECRVLGLLQVGRVATPFAHSQHAGFYISKCGATQGGALLIVKSVTLWYNFLRCPPLPKA